MNFNELRDAIHETARSKGWWPENKEPWILSDLIPEKLMLIVTEIAEAMEDYRNHPEYAFMPVVDAETGEEDDYFAVQYGEEDEPDKPVGFGVELADAIIRILDLCGALQIDIQRALLEKIRYNKTRSFCHGGKKA